METIQSDVDFTEYLASNKPYNNKLLATIVGFIIAKKNKQYMRILMSQLSQFNKKKVINLLTAEGNKYVEWVDEFGEKAEKDDKAVAYVHRLRRYKNYNSEIEKVVRNSIENDDTDMDDTDMDEMILKTFDDTSQIADDKLMDVFYDDNVNLYGVEDLLHYALDEDGEDIKDLIRSTLDNEEPIDYYADQTLSGDDEANFLRKALDDDDDDDIEELVRKALDKEDPVNLYADQPGSDDDIKELVHDALDNGEHGNFCDDEYNFDIDKD